MNLLGVASEKKNQMEVSASYEYVNALQVARIEKHQAYIWLILIRISDSFIVLFTIVEILVMLRNNN